MASSWPCSAAQCRAVQPFQSSSCRGKKETSGRHHEWPVAWLSALIFVFCMPLRVRVRQFPSLHACPCPIWKLIREAEPVCRVPIGNRPTERTGKIGPTAVGKGKKLLSLTLAEVNLGLPSAEEKKATSVLSQNLIFAHTCTMVLNHQDHPKPASESQAVPQQLPTRWAQKVRP